MGEFKFPFRISTLEQPLQVMQQWVGSSITKTWTALMCLQDASCLTETRNGKKHPYGFLLRPVGNFESAQLQGQLQVQQFSIQSKSQSQAPVISSSESSLSRSWPLPLIPWPHCLPPQLQQPRQNQSMQHVYA